MSEHAVIIDLRAGHGRTDRRRTEAKALALLGQIIEIVGPAERCRCCVSIDRLEDVNGRSNGRRVRIAKRNLYRIAHREAHDEIAQARDQARERAVSLRRRQPRVRAPKR